MFCRIDDTLILAQNQKEHGQRLRAVFQKLDDTNVTLNEEKCAFSKHKISSLGHVLDENGIQVDPDKTAAIISMSTPNSITDLQCIMGMVNHLGKFSPQIATISELL